MTDIFGVPDSDKVKRLIEIALETADALEQKGIAPATGFTFAPIIRNLAPPLRQAAKELQEVMPPSPHQEAATRS